MVKQLLEVGDLVRLKSGSPNLVVVEIINATAKCIWMQYGTSTMMEAWIPIIALTLQVNQPQQERY